MQKRGKDRPIITSTPIIVLGVIAAAMLLGWFLTRETTPLELSYGQFNGILKSEDAGARFANVKVSKDRWVRGDMIVTDTVSDGKGAPKQQTKLVPFRANIGLPAAQTWRKVPGRPGSHRLPDRPGSSPA